MPHDLRKQVPYPVRQPACGTRQPRANGGGEQIPKVACFWGPFWRRATPLAWILPDPDAASTKNLSTKISRSLIATCKKADPKIRTGRIAYIVLQLNS